MTDTDLRAAVEAAYRRGVHQALARAADWVSRCRSLPEALALLDAAESQARGLRRVERDHGALRLLDEIDGRLRGASRPT